MKIWVKKSLFKNLPISAITVSYIIRKLSNLDEKFTEFFSKHDKVNSKLQQYKTWLTFTDKDYTTGAKHCDKFAIEHKRGKELNPVLADIT